MSTSRLPEYQQVVRTCFSNDKVWSQICDIIRATMAKSHTPIQFLDDPAHIDMTSAALPKLLPKGYQHVTTYLFDKVSNDHAEHPLLVVDLYANAIRQFRTVPAQVFAVAANLSLTTIDFNTLERRCAPDGVFRGNS